MRARCKRAARTIGLLMLCCSILVGMGAVIGWDRAVVREGTLVGKTHYPKSDRLELFWLPACDPGGGCKLEPVALAVSYPERWRITLRRGDRLRDVDVPEWVYTDVAFGTTWTQP